MAVGVGGQGPKFPALLFNEALARVRGFADNVPAGTAVPRQAALEALGYAVKNGAAMRTLNALRRYGLLERSDKGYRVSELASRILWPRTREDGRAARMVAAWTPDVFGMIRDLYGPDPGSDGEVRRWLEELGVPPGACTRAIKVYRDVVAEVGCGVGAGRDPGHGAFPLAARPSFRPDHTVIFEYRMVNGAVVSIDLEGDMDHVDVLRIVEAWTAFKRAELSKLPER